MVIFSGDISSGSPIQNGDVGGQSIGGIDGGYPVQNGDVSGGSWISPV